MFVPKYTITSKLLLNIKRISILIFELNSKQYNSIVLTKMESSAREISAFSSTSIEGNPLPLTEVKRILKNKPQNLRDSEQEIINYNDTLINMKDYISQSIIGFDLSLILKIHKGVTSKLLNKFQIGKLRQESVFVNDPKKRQTIYLPPDHADIKKQLEELIIFANTNKSLIDPLILAGIFHKQFVIIHPFVDGNGRTARLVTKLILATMGLNTFNLFSFENYYNNNVSKYFEMVGIKGNYYEIKDAVDFTPWLEYFTDGIIDELLRVGQELKTSALTPDTELKDYHHQILNYINKHGYITDKDYARLTIRAKPTRNIDFNKLIKQGYIERLGKGRATYYKNVVK
ncbi:MAG: Fic family protein [Candidatus Margulisbacteria bacterium]|nr:Fic family protein [Candidatus Margulisiibacteriota bacterium]